MFDKQLFEELSKKSESKTLDFKATQYDFPNKTADFIKDIVSFANTRRSETAYIILGIKENRDTWENERCGITKYIGDEDFQQRIWGKVDPCPEFTCHRYLDDKGIEYEIIEIPVFKYDKPCTIVENMKKLEFGEVYFRRGTRNTRANRIEYDRIQKWLDSLPSSSPTGQKQQSLFKLIRKHSRQKFEKVLKNEYSHRDPSETILPNIKDTGQTFQEAVQDLWSASTSRHAVVIGEGGMGKTTSFLALWNYLLSSDEDMPIPLYIALQDYNREEMPEQKSYFLWHKIIQHYYPEEESIPKLKKLFNYNENDLPSFVLLLDGFNEVNNTADPDLISNLEDLAEQGGIQILISSRYDVAKQILSFSDFHVWSLEDLTKQQIQDFMQAEGENFDEHLLQEIPLLKNPMMLTLYCVAEKEMRRPDSSAYQFIRPPRYKAEIFYNYFVSQQSRLDRRPGSSSPIDRALHYLYLHHLLPKIGYHMEMNHCFKLSDKELSELIKTELEQYRQDEFIWSHETICNAMPDIEERLQPNNRNVSTAIKILKEGKIAVTEKLFGDEAIHQDYRAYFAAAYIKTSLENFLQTSDTAHIECFQKHLLAPHLRKMLGELTGEPRRRPVLKGGCRHGELSETLLDRILESLRANPPKPCGDNNYTLLNVIEILKDTRKDFSDTNLSGLDLRHVVLNNVRLGHTEAHGVNLSGSLISMSALLPQWHEKWVNDVCYSPDGKKFVSVGEDRYVKEWNTASGECVTTYRELLSASTCVCYSPDGTKIAVGYKDGLIIEWEITDQEDYLEVYAGHEGEITSVCYSSDGIYLFSHSKDGTIRQWETESGKCLMKHEGHAATVIITVNPEKQSQIVSGGNDGTIKIWNIELGSCEKVLGIFKLTHQALDDLTRVTFRLTARSLESLIGEGIPDKIIESLRSLEDKEFKEESFILNQQSFKKLEDENTPDEILKALKSIENKEIFGKKEFLDTVKEYIGESQTVKYETLILKHGIKEDEFLMAIQAQIEKEQAEQYQESILKYAKHQDISDEIAEALDDLIEQPFTTEAAFLTAIEKHIGQEESKRYQKLILERALISQGITTLTYSFDGKKLVAGSKDGIIREWDVETGKCLHTYEGHLDSISSVCYNADGTKIFSSASSDPKSTRDTSIKAWDVKTGEVSIFREQHARGVNALGYNSKTDTLVSASYDNAIREWNLRSGECIRTYPGYPREISCVQYSRDGKTLVSGNLPGTIKRWNRETGECLQGFQGNSQGKPFVRFSADEQYILLIGDDGLYEKWDAKTGACVFSHKQTDEKVWCFSPNGERILSVTSQGMIREREANSDKPPTAYLESLEGKRMISWLCYRADGKAFLAAYHTVNHNVIEEWYLGEERPRFRKEVIKHRITSATIKTVSELRERRIEADKASKLESLTLFNTLADKSQIRSELEQTDFTQEEIDTILKYAETITNLQISFVCYCPDEQKILLIRQEIGSEESEGGGKSIIEEWQREPWTYLREYEGTYPKISSVRYSPDGAKILAANQHLVLEWDTAEHVAPPRVYPGFPPFAQVTSIDYSADGTRILAGGTDNTMREWDANIEECHNTIEDIFGLFIQGVNLTNARFEPEISDEEKKLLNRFGGRNLK